MPPKKTQQSDACEEEGATAGLAAAGAESAISPGGSVEANLVSLARMFESYMHLQMERDKRQEKEAVKQDQKFNVLSHQVAQLQLDLEATRLGQLPSRTTGVPNGEPKLQKLEDTDDIEHFITTFERLAEVYSWPRREWAVRLIPLLTGKARSAFVAMDPGDTKKYDLLKAAILKKYEINRETYRQWFRSYETPVDESPAELYTRLKLLFSKWIDYETCTKEDIMEKMVLEQYLKVLYPEVRAWVKEQNPASAAAAAKLVDAYVTAHKGPVGYRYAGQLKLPGGKSEGLGKGGGSVNSALGQGSFRKRQPEQSPKTPSTQIGHKVDIVCHNCGEVGHTRPFCPIKKPRSINLCSVPRPEFPHSSGLSLSLTVTLLVNGKPLVALLDTGCSHSLVEERFLQRDLWNVEETVPVVCVHGHSLEVPTAMVYIEVYNQSYLMKVGVVHELPYPVLLGMDFPILLDLIQNSRAGKCGVVTRSKAREVLHPHELERPEMVLADPVIEHPVAPDSGLPAQEPGIGGTQETGALNNVSDRQTSVENTDIVKLMPFFDEQIEVAAKPTLEDRLETRRDQVSEWLQLATEQADQEVEAPELTVDDVSFTSNLTIQQRNDPTLVECFRKVGSPPSSLSESFVVENGLLYRESEYGKQLVLPEVARADVLRVGHTIPWAGHLGFMKTFMRISKRFYWPKMYKQVQDYCKSCPECQLTAGKNVAPAPLIPLPVIATPFERVGVDIVGPVERSQAGNKFILVICDYATRYPEAFPLREVTAKQVATAMLKFFSQVGIPREVLTDQGPNFMSRTLLHVYKLLGIKRVRTTPYHPQTDGLVERFNKTLISMLKKFVSDTGKDWDKWLPFLLFAYREVPQSSTGFSPFELIYAHQVRGPLDVLRETWEEFESPQAMNIVSFVVKMREKLMETTALARDNLLKSQVKQKEWYDRSARKRSFVPGEEVLLLLPTSENKLLAKWQGPYRIKQKMGDVTYQIYMPERKQPLHTFHVNMLKKWHPRPVSEASVPRSFFVRAVTEEEDSEEQYMPGTEEETQLDLTHLSEDRRLELLQVLPLNLFLQLPGRTELLKHHISLRDPTPLRQPAYRVPERLLPVLKKELEMMKNIGVIEPSVSEWSSPIILVPKKDSSLRFCLDLRRVNSVSKMDLYPMPRVDDLVERLGSAMYISTLDLCKGYWQIPLTNESKEITAFRTPFGHFQFTVLPFGLHGAPATFQRMMDGLLRGAESYAAAYLDDVVIYSSSWPEHLLHLKDVLHRIKEAGLTIRPDKCALAKQESKYLGFVLGKGVIRPQVGKVDAIMTADRPRTKSQVKSFLGLVGWYRRFIPRFSTLSAPLTDLTRKNQPNKIQWTKTCEDSFQALKSALCKEPVLKSPDFHQPFVLQTDASDKGVGAALLQGETGSLQPVLYISRKLNKHEVKYSVVEKECLAIKWALDSLRYYLLGRRFILETDHRALSWLQNMRDTNSRITRWFLAMQPFDFDVLYRKGKENCIADYLSRTSQVPPPEGGGNVMV